MTKSEKEKNMETKEIIDTINEIKSCSLKTDVTDS